MNLCIDIGNTRVKLAFFDEKEALQKLIVWPKLRKKKLRKQLQAVPVQQVMLSSVRRKNKALRRYLQKELKLPLLRLTSKTPLPIDNQYETPKTLGRDRIAGVVGAHALYPQSPVLVIDAGTCITYDLIDAQGLYKGGSISPGLRLRYRVLHQFTGRLPLVEWGPLEACEGRNTAGAIQTGVQCGLVYEIEGFIAQYRAAHPQLRVVLTGGDADYFQTRLKEKTELEAHLVLIGLNKILNYNVESLDA